MIVTEGMPLVKIKALFLLFLLRMFKKKIFVVNRWLSSFSLFILSNRIFLCSNITVVMDNFNTFENKKVKQKLLDGYYNHGELPKVISVKLLMDFVETPLSAVYRVMYTKILNTLFTTTYPRINHYTRP